MKWESASSLGVLAIILLLLSVPVLSIAGHFGLAVLAFLFSWAPILFGSAAWRTVGVIVAVLAFAQAGNWYPRYQEEIARFQPANEEPEAERQFVATLEHGELLSTLAFSSDGTVLASGSHDSRKSPGAIKIWDPRTGELRHTLVMRHISSISDIVFSSDGATLFAAGSTPNTVGADDIKPKAVIEVWDAVTWEWRLALSGPRWVSEAQISSDGLMIAGLTKQPRHRDLASTVTVWDLGTGELIRQQELPLGIHETMFFPDGRRVAGTDFLNTTIWDWITGEQVELLTGVGWTGRAEVSPSSDRIVTADTYSVSIWRLTNPVTQVHRLEPGWGPMKSLCWSADGRVFAADYWSETKVWNSYSGEIEQTFQELIPRVLAFSPVETLLAIGDRETIQISSLE